MADEESRQKYHDDSDGIKDHFQNKGKSEDKMNGLKFITYDSSEEGVIFFAGSVVPHTVYSAQCPKEVVANVDVDGNFRFCEPKHDAPKSFEERIFAKKKIKIIVR